MFVIVSYCWRQNDFNPFSTIVSGLFQTELEANQMCKKLISSFTGSDVEYAGQNTWIIKDKNKSSGFKFVYQVREIQTLNN